MFSDGVAVLNRKLLELKRLREQENDLLMDIIEMAKEYHLYVNLERYRASDKKWLV